MTIGNWIFHSNPREVKPELVPLHNALALLHGHSGPDPAACWQCVQMTKEANLDTCAHALGTVRPSARRALERGLERMGPT